MKIKTSELTNLALDWAVAKCKEIPVTYHNDGITREIMRLHSDGQRYNGRFNPSTCWAQGGPLIDLGNIDTFKQNNGFAGAIEMATRANPHPRPYFGPTTLIAVCRCYVASKLGDEVDVPEKLLCPSPPTSSTS